MTLNFKGNLKQNSVEIPGAMEAEEQKETLGRGIARETGAFASEIDESYVVSRGIPYHFVGGREE